MINIVTQNKPFCGITCVFWVIVHIKAMTIRKMLPYKWFYAQAQPILSIVVINRINRSHLDAQILDTDNFLRSIELTVIYSKYAKSILKLRIKKFSRVTDW